MNEPQRSRNADRRHHHVSHEELRRQLLAADEERYRLQHEIRAPRSSKWTRVPPVRRRVAIGVGTLLMTALVGGLAWEMCPSTARASEPRPVRVVTTVVTPQVIVGEDPPAKAEKVQLRTPASVRLSSVSKPRLSRVPSPDGVRRASAPQAVKPAPRPLSPGEFGRPRAAS